MLSTVECCVPRSRGHTWPAHLADSGRAFQGPRGRRRRRGRGEGARRALAERPPSRVPVSWAPSRSHWFNLQSPSHASLQGRPRHAHAHTHTRTHARARARTHAAVLGSSPPRLFLFPREPHLSGRSRDTFLSAHRCTEKVSLKCRRHGHARTLCRAAQSTWAPGPQPRTRWAGQSPGTVLRNGQS